MARLFGKKNQDTNQQVPAELEQYYEREPAWKVWVRRIVAVIIVLALLFGVFLLARAVYRSVTDDGNDNAATSQEEREREEAENQKQEEQKQQEEQNNAQPNQSSQTQGEGTGQDQEDAQPNTVPRTGDDPSDAPLPSTGDNPTDQPPTPATLPSTGG